MSRIRAMGAIGAAGLTAATFASAQPVAAEDHSRVQHVLLLSVDGLHQSDLSWYIQQHPESALAVLVERGVDFTNAQTPVPSDSFPGLVGQITGGNPSSTGIFYDDSWNRALLPAGTTNRVGATPGAEVTYFEAADKNPLALDAGQGLTGLPGSILPMTSNPIGVIDPAQLPSRCRDLTTSTHRSAPWSRRSRTATWTAALRSSSRPSTASHRRRPRL